MKKIIKKWGQGLGIYFDQEDIKIRCDECGYDFLASELINGKCTDCLLDDERINEADEKAKSKINYSVWESSVEEIGGDN